MDFRDVVVVRTNQKWFAPLASVLLILILSGCANESDQQIGQNSADEGPKLEIEGVPQVVFFGDSITAGYGLRSRSEAFPALIQRKMDEAGLAFEVVNAGESGETTSGGLRRIDWITSRSPNMAIFVLELGGNDGLRGIPTDLTKRNLSEIIDKVRAAQPGVSIILAGMQIPANLGGDYTRRFARVFPEVAEAKNVALIPFILEDVGGVRRLNQPDGIHPTAAGHEIIAETVWEVLEDVALAAGATN